MKRKISLDIVRVLAMFLIVIFHWNVFKDTQNIDTGYVFFHYIANGTIANIGVSLFFILSGASLMISCKNGLKIKTFYKKRFLSIYPMYWVFYAAIFVYAFILRKQPLFAPLYTLAFTVLGIDGFIAYKVLCLYMIGEWFVGCIIIIYIIFPILYHCVKKWPVVTAAAAVIVYVVLVLLYPFEMEPLHFPIVRVPEVLFGMYFINWLQNGQKPLSPRSKIVWGGCGIVSLVVFLIFVFVKIEIPDAFSNLIMGVTLFVFLTWVFDWVKDTRSPVVRAIKFVSNYSYAIFLLHHAISGDFLCRFAGQTISTPFYYGLFVIYFVVVFIAAVVLSKITEFIIRAITKVFSRG